jgi:hypothetical protein
MHRKGFRPRSALADVSKGALRRVLFGEDHPEASGGEGLPGDPDFYEPPDVNGPVRPTGWGGGRGHKSNDAPRYASDGAVKKALARVTRDHRGLIVALSKPAAGAKASVASRGIRHVPSHPFRTAIRRLQDSGRLEFKVFPTEAAMGSALARRANAADGFVPYSVEAVAQLFQTGVIRVLEAQRGKRGRSATNFVHHASGAQTLCWLPAALLRTGGEVSCLECLAAHRELSRGRSR